jgi:hypothetical protein
VPGISGSGNSFFLPCSSLAAPLLASSIGAVSPCVGSGGSSFLRCSSMGAISGSGRGRHVFVGAGSGSGQGRQVFVRCSSMGAAAPMQCLYATCSAVARIPQPRWLVACHAAAPPAFSPATRAHGLMLLRWLRWCKERKRVVQKTPAAGGQPCDCGCWAVADGCRLCVKSMAADPCKPHSVTRPSTLL